MANTVPSAINDARMYINGSASVSGVGEVELPNIEYATVTSEQFGMVSEFEVPLQGHFKKMETKIKMDSMDSTMLNLNNNDSILIEVKGTLQSLDKKTHGIKIENITATMKGLIKKIDSPKMKPGQKTEGSIDISTSFYSLDIGGKNIIEVDVLSNVAKINGSTNDLIRKFLGML